MGKVTLLAGLAAGYVLGTRDGRERYEQIRTQATKVMQDPRVKRKATQAQDKVSQATHRASGDAAGSTAGSTTPSSSTTPSPAPDVAGDTTAGSGTVTGTTTAPSAATDPLGGRDV